VPCRAQPRVACAGQTGNRFRHDAHTGITEFGDVARGRVGCGRIVHDDDLEARVVDLQNRRQRTTQMIDPVPGTDHDRDVRLGAVTFRKRFSAVNVEPADGLDEFMSVDATRGDREIDETERVGSSTDEEPRP
jgi:hypothetical protein